VENEIGEIISLSKYLYTKTKQVCKMFLGNMFSFPGSKQLSFDLKVLLGGKPVKNPCISNSTFTNFAMRFYPPTTIIKIVL